MTNATVVDDAIRFVSDKPKDKETIEGSEGQKQRMINKVF
jgi:hypothetical protein